MHSKNVLGFVKVLLLSSNDVENILHLWGVRMGALTGLTGEGDWWRVAATFDTPVGGVGDLEVGFGGTRGGVLWAKSPSSISISIMAVDSKEASILCEGQITQS